MARVRGLGASWYRPPSLFIGKTADICNHSCLAWRDSGLSLAITVRSGAPGEPPLSFPLWEKNVQRVLQNWNPAALILEENEDSLQFYQDPSSQFEGYTKQIETGCALARKQNVLCLNGGLSFSGAVLARWYHLLEEKGQQEACAFAHRALDSGREDYDADFLCRIASSAVAEKQIGAHLNRIKALLTLYRTSKIDAVNFHWYSPDAFAFAETVRFLSNATGKPVVCAEIGLRPWEAKQEYVKPLLRAAHASHVKILIWKSVETAKSASFFEPNGSLRPTGWAFQDQLLSKRR